MKHTDLILAAEAAYQAMQQATQELRQAIDAAMPKDPLPDCYCAQYENHIGRCGGASCYCH